MAVDEESGFGELARFRNALNPSTWKIVLVLARADKPLSVREIAERTGLVKQKGLYEAERITNTLLHRIKDLQIVSKQKKSGQSIRYALQQTSFSPGNKAIIQIPMAFSSNVQEFDFVRQQNMATTKLLFNAMRVLHDGTKILVQKKRDVLNHEFVLDVGVMLKTGDYFDDLKPLIQQQLELFEKTVETDKTKISFDQACWNSYFGNKPVYGTALLLSYVDERAMTKESIEQGVNYLLSKQRKDGSWSDKETRDELESEYEWEQIATVLFALAKHAKSKQAQTARKKAIQLIEKNQIHDESNPFFGMWVMKFKNLEPTYFNPTMRLLYELGRLDPEYVHQKHAVALKHIEKGQQPDGHWIAEAMFRDQHFSKRKTDLIRGTVNGVLLLTEVERKPFDPKTIKAVEWLIAQFSEINDTSGPSSYSLSWLLYRLAMWLRIGLNHGNISTQTYF